MLTMFKQAIQSDALNKIQEINIFLYRLAEQIKKGDDDPVPTVFAMQLHHYMQEDLENDVEQRIGDLKKHIEQSRMNKGNPHVITESPFDEKLRELFTSIIKVSDLKPL